MITHAAMAAPASARSSSTVAIINVVVDTRSALSPVGACWSLTTKGERRLKIVGRISAECDVRLRAHYTRHLVELVGDNFSYLIMRSQH